MVYHDMICDHCGQRVTDLPLRVEGTKCTCKKGVMEIAWSAPSSRDAAVHTSERTVVWRHPGTGQIRYPARNDVPIPERYRREGFERHEIPSLKGLEKFSAEHNVRSETAWYDRGSGRGFDDAR